MCAVDREGYFFQIPALINTTMNARSLVISARPSAI